MRKLRHRVLESPTTTTCGQVTWVQNFRSESHVTLSLSEWTKACLAIQILFLPFTKANDFSVYNSSFGVKDTCISECLKGSSEITSVQF